MPLEESYTTENAVTSALWDTSARKWSAVQYVAGKSYTLTKFELSLKRHTLGIGDTLTGYVYSDSTGPNASLGTSTNTVSTTDIPTANTAYFAFNFSGISITNGTTYWLVIACSGTAGAKYIAIDNNTAGAVYVDGDGSGTWTSYATDKAPYKCYSADTSGISIPVLQASYRRRRS
ncbi:MAG: choice-of-anchor R domain-containing protein [Smithella sp.]